ncbi:mitochondrial fission ELM1 family protein [Luteimonas sp. WGS1318]|uniref:mitochondrial fission ELM1 family protein n=1 Tax=Luteimonas sp. WGS1318 TaxID=3366815 RepID=UPI00372D346E
MERAPPIVSDYHQIWAVSDGRAGNARQAEALAEALSGEAHALHLQTRAPWRWLAPRRLPGAEAAFGPDFAAALRRPPALAIGCGRQAALATRLAGHRGARTVQILDPRLDARHWDLVVVPQHDAVRGDNVLVTRGSLHPVDDVWLAAARRAHPAIGTLPGPRTGVLLGGDSRHGRFDVAAFSALAGRLDALVAADGGSLLLVGSRRTPEAVRAALRTRYHGRAGLLWADEGDGPNPYPGVLAWADRLVCSADSVNMLSEACATRAPVFAFEPQRVDGRPRQFVDGLIADGRVQVLGEALQTAGAVTPLRETARIAAEIRARLLADAPGP